jgi:hypothetical protein
MRRGTHGGGVILAAMLATATVHADTGGDATIGEEYRTVWQRLVDTHVDVGESETRVERSADLARAWDLMGTVVASTLAQRAGRIAGRDRRGTGRLNPEDRVGPCEGDEFSGDLFCRLQRFVIAADVLPLGGDPPVVAVALRYSYFGRLLVVSRTASRRRSRWSDAAALHALPDATSGAATVLRVQPLRRLADQLLRRRTLSVWRWDGRAGDSARRSWLRRAPILGCTDDRALGSRASTDAAAGSSSTRVADATCSPRAPGAS